MPKGIKLVRAIREGVRSFVRSGWLSVSAILTIALALFIIGLSGVEAIATHSILKNLEEKMDITVSFEANVSEDRILAIKSELEKYREIQSVSYTSSETALEKFRAQSEATGNGDVINQALEEIGENPLYASLSIKAQTPEQYKIINGAIEKSSFKDDIFRLNYRENESIINQLMTINQEVVRQGAILGVIFLLIAFLVTFNTIRLTMYSRREDFEIMRLVGASNLYVRIPSVVEGILYGSIAALVSMAFLYFYIEFQRINPFSRDIIEGAGLMGSFTHNIAWIFLGLLALGVSIGFLSGFLAVRRYMKI
jgi:cell division transport system permease protein